MAGRTSVGVVLLFAALFVCVRGISLSRLFRISSGIQDELEEPRAAAVSSHVLNGATSDLSPAGIVVAARHGLFDYLFGLFYQDFTQTQEQFLPDVFVRFSIPIIGSINLQLEHMVISFATSNAKLTKLRDGHLRISDIAANVTFKWRWNTTRRSGSGEGELVLSGGTIDLVYDVREDEELQEQQVQISQKTNFDSVDLKIHSHSKAEWLYQAISPLLSEVVKRRVHRHFDCDRFIDDCKEDEYFRTGSLPTRVDVRRLPFSASFEYPIYSASFVLGFGKIEVPQGLEGTVAQSRRSQQYRRLAAVASEYTWTQMAVCPFEPSPLPLSREAIAADPGMVSIYVHEATANCLLSGLYRSGKLVLSLKDGTIPGLTITTDLLALLVPELPTKYPHQKMIINVEALDAPSVSFQPDDGGATLAAFYRLSLVVANDTLGNPEVVRLLANLRLNGAFDWDTTRVGEVAAIHQVEHSELSVPAEQWDNAFNSLIAYYGEFVSLRQVVEAAAPKFTRSGITLGNSHASFWDKWYGLSADVEVDWMSGTYHERVDYNDLR